MSNCTTIPDAIVFPDGTIRLVTASAKSWVYSNTDINHKCTSSTVPDYDPFEDPVIDAMEKAGLAIKREQMPVSHYRSKRRRWPKSAASSDADVIDFLQRIPEEQREKAMFRAYGRHRQRHHRMQEAKKRSDADKE